MRVWGFLIVLVLSLKHAFCAWSHWGTFLAFLAIMSGWPQIKFSVSLPMLADLFDTGISIQDPGQCFVLFSPPGGGFIPSPGCSGSLPVPWWWLRLLTYLHQIKSFNLQGTKVWRNEMGFLPFPQQLKIIACRSAPPREVFCVLLYLRICLKYPVETCGKELLSECKVLVLPN